MVVRKKVLILAAALSVSCGKLDIVNMLLPLSTDVNKRVEQSLEWNKSAGTTTISVPEDSYRFYVCSDVHVEEARPARFARMVETEKEDQDAFFYQVLGDLLFGTEHLDWITDIVLDPANDPSFVIAGNHDLFFDMWDTWRENFHTSTYYYFVKTPSATDLYIMLDSANGTLGEKQTAWLEEVIRENRPGCRHCIVSVHTNMFRTDTSQFPSTNFTLEETYRLTSLFSRSSVDLVLSGHDHVHDVSSFGGVTYITLDDIKDNTDHASYMTVDVGTGVEYAFVPLQ